MSDQAEVVVKFEMRDGFAEVRVLVDHGPGYVEYHGPYLITEMADVVSVVRHVSKDVAASALAFLAKTGEEVA